MSDRILEVKYKCIHPSCIVSCREGVLMFDEDIFVDLRVPDEGSDLFRSPRGVCRMGYAQRLRIVEINEVDTETFGSTEGDTATGADASLNPMAMLQAEHEKVLEHVLEVERQLKLRDVEGLWRSTTRLENEIMLHSVQKEEEVLFPLVHDKLPFADGLITIVKEDHREFITLLHSFRNALVDDDILDGLGRSIIVNLKSHIKKEDTELFPLLDRSLDGDTKRTVLEAMKKVAETFVPVELRDRKEYKNLSTASRRRAFDEAAHAAREARLADAASGGGCCHE